MQIDLVRLCILLAVAIANAALAMVVFLRNRKSRANIAFTAAVFAIIIWLTLDFVGDQPLFAPSAEIVKRITLAAGLLMGSLLVGFALVFPRHEARFSRFWQVYFAGSAGLMAITILTRLVQASAAVTPNGTQVTFGPLMPLFTAWAIGGIAAMATVFWEKYRRAEGREAAQLRYVLIGAVLFAVGAMTFGLVLPLIVGASWPEHLVPVATLALVGYTAYAIVKHRMLDVRLVVLRTAAHALLVVVAAALLVLPAVIARTDARFLQYADRNLLFFGFGLVAVLGFQPLQRLLERATDRYLYRASYDPDKLLNELGRAMSSTLDIDDLGLLLTERLARTLRLSSAAVIYYRAEVPVAVGSGVEYTEPDATRFLALSRSGSTIVTDDLEAGDERAMVLADYQVRVLVPLCMDGEVFGAIALGRKESGDAFSAQDLALLDILGPEASIAMRNGHLFDEKNQRVEELTALNQLAYALGADIELESVLDTAMAQLVAVTQADSGSIMLLDAEKLTLTISASRGLNERVVRETVLPVGSGVAGWVVKTREPLILVDDTDPRFALELQRAEIVSAISAPIICKDEVIGVLNVNRGAHTDIFTRENLNVVTSFAGQMAVVIENARLYRDLENTILGTITALAAAVDAKDPYTFGHSQDVTGYCMGVAERLGMSGDELQTLRIAATLHDIGKIGIDGAILNKPGKLTAEEFDAMRKHPVIGADILASLDFLRDAVPLILFHHERFGGGGYPTGVSGEAIPQGARIITVADAFNAMTSDRPYRKALTVAEARAELLRFSGDQFDPAVVQAFLDELDGKPVTERSAVAAAYRASGLAG